MFAALRHRLPNIDCLRVLPLQREWSRHRHQPVCQRAAGGHGSIRAESPGGDRRRGKERNIARQLVQRPKRQVVRVRMRQQDPIELGQLRQRDAWLTDPWEETPKGVIEIGIGEEPSITEFDQESRVADVSNAH